MGLIVGVLGGMGPEATVDLMRRVIDKTPAEDDRDHVRLIVDQNPQVPSRIAALIEGTGESPAPVLAEMARGLASLGCAALAMPCNTAHAYLREIREATDVPVLDMVALTADRLKAGGHRRIGVLASTAVKITGLYGRAFAARGMEALWPIRQDDAMALIRGVKRGETGAEARAGLASLAAGLASDGADAVCIACTEFSVIAEGMEAGVPVLDAMDVLAGEIARIGRPAPADA